MGHKFPNRPAYDDFLKENKKIFLGESERFGPYVQPEFFKTPEEAELWIENFLSRQPDPDDFDLKVVKCQIEQEDYDNHFKEKNFYIKIQKLPHVMFEKRPNLKMIYLNDELVLGRGNAVTRLGNQKWFKTREEAEFYIDKLMKNATFEGFEFIIAERYKF